eukprot:SAG11_NODE_883_length_6737_cov_10.576981_8_plen_99_part_00
MVCSCAGGQAVGCCCAGGQAMEQDVVQDRVLCCAGGQAVGQDVVQAVANNQVSPGVSSPVSLSVCCLPILFVLCCASLCLCAVQWSPPSTSSTPSASR